MFTKFKLPFVAGIFVAICCGAAFAQDTISPQKKALILEYLELTGGKKAADDGFNLMLGMQEAQTEKLLTSMIDDDKVLSSAEKSKLKKEMLASADRTSKRVRTFFTERIDFDEILRDTIVPIFDEHFTESELTDLTVFYRSPTGQKTISFMPKMMVAMITMATEKLIPKMEEFMKEVSESELALLKQKVKPAVKKSVRKS